MSSEEVVKYFKTFYSSKASSLDRWNEAYYLNGNFAANLYKQIDNLMPVPLFLTWLKKTKSITDKNDGNGGNSKKYSYKQTLNARCNPESAFNQRVADILKSWDGDRTIISNELDTWHKKNALTPSTEMCNRFRGLTCQYKRAVDPKLDQGKIVEMTNYTTCQCSGDSTNIGFFEKGYSKSSSYPDGCYVRPWKPCSFLSMDSTFHDQYDKWHSSLQSVKRTLAQMVFPVGRTHRCKEGTYCLDIIPGMKKPICWCEPDSEDKVCKLAAQNTKNRIPVGPELANIRKLFMKHIIPKNDRDTPCNPEYNEDITKLVKLAGKDPTKNSEAIEIMEEVAFSHDTINLCDFREALFCDRKSRTCTGAFGCDPGNIHLGMGVCAINNGFKCQSDQDCVPNAKCKHLKDVMESVCICEKGYGDQCKYEKTPFFGSRFLPVASGFAGDEFLNLQVEINGVLESWEDSMKRKAEQTCDAESDLGSMQLVRYFGDLQKFEKDKGLGMLAKARQIVKENHRLCRYNKFLRCSDGGDGGGKCVPMHGRKILSMVDLVGETKISVELSPDEQCKPNSIIPTIFEGLVTFVCPRGYVCRRSNSVEKCVPDCGNSFAPNKLCPPSMTLKVAPAAASQMEVPIEVENETPTSTDNSFI